MALPGEIEMLSVQHPISAIRDPAATAYRFLVLRLHDAVLDTQLGILKFLTVMENFPSFGWNKSC